MLVVSQYFISMPLNTRPLFLHLCCLDLAKIPYPLILWIQSLFQEAEVTGLVSD